MRTSRTQIVLFYQLDFTTPGISPLRASERKQRRHTPNFRRKARGRPQSWQRLCWRDLNFGFFASLTRFAVVDICFALYLYCKSVRGLLAWLRRLSSNAEGHTKALQQGAGTVVVLRRRDDGDVHTLQFVDLGVVDLSEDQLIAQAKGVVAATVEALRGNAAKVADAGKSDRDEAVKKFVHRVAAQGDHRTDRHTLAHLEGCDGLLRLGGHRLLTGDGGKIGHQGIHDLDVLGGFAEAHIDDDLLKLRDRHGVGDVELFAQRLLDLALVLLFQTCCHDFLRFLHDFRVGFRAVYRCVGGTVEPGFELPL